MDNLINNAMPGALLPTALTGVANDATSIAMQWQQQLMVPEHAIAGNIMTQPDPTHVSVDTFAMMSLQKLASQTPPAASTSTHQTLIADSTATTANKPVFDKTGQEVSVQTLVSPGVTGKPALTESRLLGWGNAGQGVLSYMPTYVNAATNLFLQQHDTQKAINVALTTTSTLGTVLSEQPRMNNVTTFSQPVASSATTQQLSKQRKEQAESLHNSRNAMVNHDIPPQALFFLLSGQQGYRATVRDYFNKEDTIKRLYQIQQEGAFTFSQVQEIWLNGKPLAEHSKRSEQYAG